MFLTPDEIEELTGLKRGRDQLRWLRERGWPVEEDAKGRPKLLAEVVRARMGGTVQHKTEPNFRALRGA